MINVLEAVSFGTAFNFSLFLAFFVLFLIGFGVVGGFVFGAWKKVY
jgi:hypothetical protein